MNKIIYVLSLLFVMLFSSCEVEEGQSGYPKTLQAKAFYDVTARGISNSIYWLDLMTKVDYYAQAPEDKKEGIKKHFLSNYSVTNTENTWTLKSDYEEITFTHNNKSLNEAGAVWTVNYVSKLWSGELIKVIEDKNFQVESLGDKNWKIITVDISYSTFYTSDDKNKDKRSEELQVKGTDTYDKLINLYDFNIEKGHGNVDVSFYKVNYEILQPISYFVNKYESDLYIMDGEISIDTGKDKINAEIKSSRINITYKGITEAY